MLGTLVCKNLKLPYFYLALGFSLFIKYNRNERTFDNIINADSHLIQYLSEKKGDFKLNKEKDIIISHYKKSIEFVVGLRDLSEVQWRKPIKQNKWSIAEIISHFIPWDEFVLESRLPYFFQKENLSKGPNVQDLNDEAAKKSRVQTKEETIERFLEIRKKLIHELLAIEEETWRQTFFIGNIELSLYQYFSNLLEHDKHHFSQIQSATDESGGTDVDKNRE